MSSNNQSTNFRFNTNAVHAGRDPDPSTGAVVPPIYLSSTYEQSSPSVHKGFEYSRSGNPNRNNFEKAVASLEGGKYGVAFASGSAATMTTVLLCEPGSHLISMDDVYGGTNRFLNQIAKTSLNLEVSFVDLSQPENLKQHLRSNTRMIWLESPSNPTLKVVDIKRIIEIAHSHSDRILVVTDNTFLSPYLQKPLEFGSDIVVHSVSKYLNGHSDVIMGIAVMKCDTIHERLRYLQNATGAVPSPFDCFLACRGLQTLHIRMERQVQNALKIAQHLESLIGSKGPVEKVIYPGLPSHPQYELARKQQVAPGAMISFVLKGSLKSASEFLSRLKIFSLAESLGGVESLAELPSTMTHAAVPLEQRQHLGISETLIRLSVGIEDAEDLIEDIDKAFNKLPS